MLILLSLALAAPPAPVVDAAAVPVDLQWAALTACARLGGGPPKEDTAATTVCLGQRDGFAYLLTAAHTVPKGEARAYSFFSQALYPKAIRSHNRGQVVLRNEDADIALVKLPIGSEPIPTARLAGPGERPKHYPFDAVSIGCPLGVSPVARAERVIGKKAVRRPGGGVAFFWQVASPAIGGMSGGPLLDPHGRVIGICAATQGDFGYFTHLDEILFSIKKSEFAWLLEPAH